jgi:hypothetical protein
MRQGTLLAGNGVRALSKSYRFLRTALIVLLYKGIPHQSSLATFVDLCWGSRLGFYVGGDFLAGRALFSILCRGNYHNCWHNLERLGWEIGHLGDVLSLPRLLGCPRSA